MAKPIMYGVKTCAPFRAVTLSAKAIGLDLELRKVNFLAGETKKSEFLQLNPQHTIPTLHDNGLIVCDSHAIVTYLIGKYAKDDSLYSKDLCKRALIDQRLHFDSGILFPRLRAIFGGIFYFNETSISSEKIQAMNEAYDFMEKFLQKDPYLAGNSLTIADFCCIASVSSTAGVVPAHVWKYPKLAAWMERMEQLPYYEEMNGKGLREFIGLAKNKLG